MGKAPADQFYWMDWSRDLQEHPLKIEGAWIRICCKLWWSDTKGEMSKSPIQWGRILGVSKANAMGILEYIKKEKIGDVTFRNPKVTVACRRMVRDEKARKANREKASRWRDREKEKANPKSNPKVTPPSSSSSSSSTSKDKKKAIFFDRFWEEYPVKNGRKKAEEAFKKVKSIKDLMPKILASIEEQKKDKISKKASGEFVAEFQDPERWIKNERWNDEIQASEDKTGLDPRTCRKCQKLSDNIYNGHCPVCQELMKGKNVT